MVVLTFQDERGFRDRAMALGADGFLTKAEIGWCLIPLIDARFPGPEARAVSAFKTLEYAETIFATAQEAFILLDDELRGRAVPPDRPRAQGPRGTRQGWGGAVRGCPVGPGFIPLE